MVYTANWVIMWYLYTTYFGNYIATAIDFIHPPFPSAGALQCRWIWQRPGPPLPPADGGWGWVGVGWWVQPKTKTWKSWGFHHFFVGWEFRVSAVIIFVGGEGIIFQGKHTNQPRQKTNHPGDSQDLTEFLISPILGGSPIFNVPKHSRFHTASQKGRKELPGSFLKEWMDI